MKIQESKLKEIAKETIHQVLDETSRRQKAQQSIMGKNRRVKTMAIISAYNPMGGDGTNLPEHYNKQAHEELINNLRVGQFKYFEVVGKYKTFEKSVIAYNISLDDTLFLCYKYNQESVIFIDLTDDNEISYQYWEGDEHNSRLKKQREEHEITNAANDTDAYTQISKKFKFRIPFFESIQNYINELDERSKIYDVDKLISECLEDGWSGKHKYICRGKLHGKLPNL